ncbi:MAG: sulfatase-like hydrolase/transferase [Novosphingobium sp.]
MRLAILSLCGCFGLFLSSCAGIDSRESATPGDKPNVVVILADDLGFADVSSYGVQRIQTPHIDRIGHEGALFTNAYVTSPVCGPSRAGLQTGRYQDRFGFEFNNGPANREVREGLGLPVEEKTLGLALKELGYHTGLVGKWHLGSDKRFYPTNRGYDEFVGFLQGLTLYMDPDDPDLVKFQEPVTEDSRPYILTERGEYYQVVEGPDATVVHNEHEYLTDYFGRRAVEFIERNAASEAPYFLYLAPNAPHAPLHVTRKYYDRFPQIEDKQSRVYAAMISALDDMVGHVLDAVEKSGEAENTIVIFLSDNGCASYYIGMCSCEPLRGGKFTHYEGGVRVPFMMRWPAVVKAGQTFSGISSSLDIFPTLVAAAGGTLPADRIYDGVDLAPFLSGEKPGSPHDELIWRRQPLFSIRKGDWKLWKSTDPAKPFTMLFNLKDDLNERQNLADKNPEKVAELEAAIRDYAKDLQDPRWPSRKWQTTDVCGVPMTLPI